ncbi:hypothetical protein L0244_29900 [bacterium]|nr:hypothetical protein [bacterium]
MDNRDKQLKFLVDFSTMKLDSFRPGDWLNLQSDIEKAFGVAARYEAEEVEQLRAIHKEVHSKIRDCAFYLIKEPDAHHILQIEVRRMIYTRDLSSPEEIHVIQGDIRDLFFQYLASSLIFLPREYLREKLQFCQRCDRVFFKTGRKLFCSRQCAVATSVQAKKERDALKEEKSKEEEKSKSRKKSVSRKARKK